MLRGSAHTRSTLGSTSSIESSRLSSWASAAKLAGTAAVSSSARSVHCFHNLRMAVLEANPAATERLQRGPRLVAHTALFALLRAFGLVRVLLRPAAWHRLIGAGAHVHEDVVEITHHVLVGAERRHDVFLRAGDVLAAVD